MSFFRVILIWACSHKSEGKSYPVTGLVYDLSAIFNTKKMTRLFQFLRQRFEPHSLTA